MELEEAPQLVEDCVKFLFLRKLDAAPEMGIMSYRATALTSVMTKWHATSKIVRTTIHRVSVGV